MTDSDARSLAELVELTAERPDDDELDGCGATGRNDTAQNTGDDDIAAVVLFADVDWTDPAAVTAREAEWTELLEATE